MCDCRCLYARVVIVVLMLRAVVSFQYDVSIFVVTVRCLLVFERFRRVKYIQLETINQINDYQYVTQLESYICILVTIIILNV